MSIAIEDSGAGEVVSLSEHNPGYRDYYRKSFPHTNALDCNSLAPAQYLTDEKIECFGSGPPCQEFTGGNKNRTGNTVAGNTGTEYEHCGEVAAAAHEGLGVAHAIIENPSGVLKKISGSKESAYEQLMSNAAQFCDRIPHTVQANRVKSPLTEFFAPMNHERKYTLLLNNRCFPKDSKIELELEDYPTEYLSSLGDFKCTLGRFTMPIQDQINFELDFRRGGAG